MRGSKNPGVLTMNDAPLAAQKGSDDGTLLLAIAEDRDRGAFAELYGRYDRAAYNLAFQLTGNSDRAAEAVQEAMLRVWTRASTFKPDGNARGWILRIVARASLRTGRKRQVESREESCEMDMLAKPVPESAAGAKALVRSEELDALRRSLERLPQRYRQIVALYYGAGLSQREISIEMDVSQKTISTQLEEALRRLRTLLAQAGVAAAAPLLEPQAIVASIEGGYAPPPDLTEQILRQLSNAQAQAGQASRALSRKTGAMTGSTALWICGAAAILVVAGYVALSGGEQAKAPAAEPKPASGVPARSAEVIAPQAEAPFRLRWAFEKGLPEGMIVYGEYTLSQPGGGNEAMLSVPKEAHLQLPFRIPNRPVRITMRFKLLDAKVAGNWFSLITRVEENGKNDVVAHLKTSAHTLRGTRPSYSAEIFVNERAVLMRLESRFYSACLFSRSIAGAHPLLSLRNMEVYEVSAETLEPDAVPEELRDPASFMERVRPLADLPVPK